MSEVYQARCKKDGVDADEHLVKFLGDGVVAVEIRQYVGEGVTVHVPRVVGHSMTTQDRAKSSENRLRWDEAKFFEHARDCSGVDATKLIRGLYDACVACGVRIGWGTEAQHGSFSPKFPDSGNIAPFTVRCDGQLSYKGAWLSGERSSSEARRLKDVFDGHLLGTKILTADEMNSGVVEDVSWDRWREHVDELAAVVEKVVHDLGAD